MKESLKRQVHLTEIERILKGKFGRAMKEAQVVGDELIITLDRESLLDFSGFVLKEKKLAFNFLRCLSGVDWPDRYEVVYHLYSMTNGCKMTLKVPLPKDNPVVSSVTLVWHGADWHERETHDMFGIKFEGHPDLRVLMLPEDAKYHPLRKDFRLGG